MVSSQQRNDVDLLGNFKATFKLMLCTSVAYGIHIELKISVKN